MDDDETVMNNDPTVVDVEYQTDPYTTTMKRSTMVKIAQELRNKYGYLLNPLVVPRQKQTELFDAILELEDDFIKSTSSMTRDNIVAMLPGDWDLIVTIPLLRTSLTQAQPPSLLDNEFLQNLFPSTLPLASLTNQFVTVTQRIRTMDTNVIDRVDHVITVQPPNQVGDIFASFSNNENNNNENSEATSWWSNLNINPLNVTESKVILVHTAQVVTDQDQVKLRLKLQSVVNNLAGTGANLDPQGSNLLSVNVPQLDFLTNNNEWNDALGGSFVTTYVDDEYRIGRSDLLLSSSFSNNDKKKPQQIRIFQKRRSVVDPMEEEDMETADVDDIAIEAPSDVED